MRVRSVQLVCIIILLSSMRMAGASVLPGSEFGRGGRYVGSVLCQDRAGVWTEITFIHTGHDWGNGNGALVMIERLSGHLPRISKPKRRPTPKAVNLGADVAAIHQHAGGTFALTVELLAAYRRAWAVKPPAAQCMTIFAVSGSRDGTPPNAAFC